jgi:hypothetical protein
MKFREVARQDDIVIRLKSVEKSIRSKINVDELVQECKKMLIARKFRSYDHTILSKATENIADWSGEIASHRARLADIRVLVLNDKMRLKKLINVARNHLGATYPEYFKGQQSRVGDKKAIIDTSLTKPLSTLDDLERLWEVSNLVAKELEDSYYSSVLIKNVIAEHNKAERI